MAGPPLSDDPVECGNNMMSSKNGVALFGGGQGDLLMREASLTDSSDLLV